MHRHDGPDKPNRVYALNTEVGRNLLAGLRKGEELQEMENGTTVQILEEELPEEKPNIFVLYEDNVGTLSPILAEQLKEVESTYPGDWVNEAFKIAVAENKRNWRYIAGILRRWAAEGKDHGKPGRHSQKDNRKKYLADYERRWNGSTRKSG
jgi:DnaD/phage-associated family protein